MAVWYCSSVKHAAVAQFAITHAYVIGDLIRQLAAPAVGSERVFRCTTAGTTAGSEPSWNLGAAATTASGTATFTEVTGNSTYGWNAAAARLLLAQTRAGAGDTVYVGHDHAETAGANNTLTGNGTSPLPQKVICVSTAGSVPPVSADLSSAATVTTTGAFNIAVSPNFASYRGVGFVANVQLTWTAAVADYKFDTCTFQGNTTTAANFASASHQNIELVNCSFSFQNVGHSIEVAGGCFTWRNSTVITGATIPTNLFNLANAVRAVVLTFDGCDFSAAGSGKTIFATPTTGDCKINCLNCKFDAAATILGTAASALARGSEVNLFNCEGTSNLRFHFCGVKSKETTIVRSGGASDGVESISWKIVTNTNNNPTFPFECFPIVVWNAGAGSPVTATVEIVNDGVTLTNADVWMEIEYLGTSSSHLASVVSSAPADPLAAAGNLTTSSETWTTSGLGSPVKQYLSKAFTPQTAGLVRITVKVSKTSQTLYVCPKPTIA